MEKLVYAVRVSPELIEIRTSYEPLKLKVTKLTKVSKSWEEVYDNSIHAYRREYRDVKGKPMVTVSLTGGEVECFVSAMKAAAAGLDVAVDKAVRLKGSIASNILSTQWRRDHHL